MQDILASGDVLAAACNRNLEFERTYEYLEKTTLEGQEIGHVAGLKRGTAQLNNLSGSALDNSETGTLFFDETARQWAETNTLMFCTWIDQPGEPTERVISFFAYITRYRAVRNNNEPANFDIDLVWTSYDVGELCPIVTFDNEITAPEEFATTYEFTPSPFINSYSIALYQDGDLIETQTKENTGALITGSFDPVDQDSLYTVQITPIGYGSELCPYAFFSYSVPCPVLTLDVGETGVDVTLVPPEGITRVSVQILDSLDPLNVLDAETTDAPFPDPFTTSFTGLDEDTQYWVRIYQRIVVDSVVQYARFCSPVPFTTGEPLPDGVTVGNQSVGGASITGVTNDGVAFITDATQAFPVTGGQQLDGDHAGFTGQIKVDVTVTANAAISLTVNGIFVQCLDAATSGAYYFDSETYLVSDQITIILQDGECA
jgi:hypothetical protein